MIVRFVLVLLLLSPAVSLCQAPGGAGRPVSAAPSLHFVCNTGYSLERCNEQMSVLRRVLSRYPTDRLGEWTWILVRSADWRPLKKRLKLDPDSPAFTFIERRETFVEEALVARVPGRSAELMWLWGHPLDELPVFVVTHELGHALCGEADERKADAYGRMLRARMEVTCGR